MKTLRRVLVLGLVVLLPSQMCKSDEPGGPGGGGPGGGGGPVPCTCTVKGDDVTCQTEYGDRTPRTLNEIALYLVNCQDRTCSGDTCPDGEKLMVDTTAIKWGTYRTNYVPPKDGAKGKDRAPGETTYCASEMVCDKCRYIAERPGIPEGRYCFPTVYDKKSIVGWMDCPNAPPSCDGPPSD